jgi:CDP-glucose 4,6-dehydratase
VENLVNSRLAIFRDKKVLLTGHTGFKGAWLALWLQKLGAGVTGFALPPATDPNLFDLLQLNRQLDSRIGDIRDASVVAKLVGETQPDFILHLAAQALVRESYGDPVGTLATNVIGTAHVLEAARQLEKKCAVVVVTSDKCYENREWIHGYRENEPLGGHDPYSMSKACAELVTASWRRSFFSKQNAIHIATARSGNVIGGGDWSRDRIMADCIASLACGEKIPVRNPNARRPWQHVLEPLRGYLELASLLYAEDGARFAQAWNFGPEASSVRTVRELVEMSIRAWGAGEWRDAGDPNAPHEAGLLSLSIEKARFEMGWRPAWNFEQAVENTVAWYRAWHDGGKDLRALCLGQIDAYAKSIQA